MRGFAIARTHSHLIEDLTSLPVSSSGVAPGADEGAGPRRGLARGMRRKHDRRTRNDRTRLECAVLLLAAPHGISRLQDDNTEY